jgi:Bifunctional DNA primase/polymerase, N-terminal
VLDSADVGVHAIEYAIHNWPIPGNGKIPAIPNPHPRGSRERRECNGECGLPGHGVHDATRDVGVVAQWWGGRYAGANILRRVPSTMFVLDVDPRNGGDRSIASLEQRHQPLPETLRTISGRGDGGVHLFYRRPPGKLSAKQLGPGPRHQTSSGYVVLAPSIHPDTGKPYTRIDHPVAAPPMWLTRLLAFEGRAATSRKPGQMFRTLTGPSVADAFCTNTSWEDILARVVGTAWIATPMPMGHAGAIHPLPPHGRPRFAMGACSYTPPTPHSR